LEKSFGFGRLGHDRAQCRSLKAIRSVYVNSVFGSLTEPLHLVKINGYQVEVIVDTEATVNVLPKKFVNFPVHLETATINLRTWTREPVKVTGVFVATVEHGKVQTQAEIVVTTQETQPLISYDLANKLGLIGSVAQLSCKEIYSVRDTQMELKVPLYIN